MALHFKLASYRGSITYGNLNLSAFMTTPCLQFTSPRMLQSLHQVYLMILGAAVEWLVACCQESLAVIGEFAEIIWSTT